MNSFKWLRILPKYGLLCLGLESSGNIIGKVVPIPEFHVIEACRGNAGKTVHVLNLRTSQVRSLITLTQVTVRRRLGGDPDLDQVWWRK
jgi:hypothetical protein